MPGNYMQNGSLTIGDANLNYGGGDLWTTNTSGLLLECSSKTEIAVHDGGTRIASTMYYEGDMLNQITIGRDMGWGAISNVAINGSLNASNYVNIVGSGATCVMFKTTDYNLGIASSAGDYSLSSLAGDMIFRTLTNTNLIVIVKKKICFAI